MALTALRCPWCHDGLAREAEVAVCRDCRAPHHAVCWLGRCASCARTRRIDASGVALPTGWEPFAAAAALPLLLGPWLLIAGGVVDLFGAESAAQSLYFAFAMWLALGAGAIGLALVLGLVCGALLCLGYLGEWLFAPAQRVRVVARGARQGDGSRASPSAPGDRDPVTKDGRACAPTGSPPRCSPIGCARSW